MDRVCHHWVVDNPMVVFKDLNKLSFKINNMTKFILSVMLCLGLLSATYGQETIAIQSDNKIKTETFTVYGNCGMCKRTIEGSLKNETGVSEAIWDIESGEMKVSFDTKSISLDDIKQKIADVGYDSDSHRAKDDVYSNLPGCCQYERPK